MRNKKPIEDRLWSKVERAGDTACWNFTGNLNKGYGVIKVGKCQKQILAARAAYECTNGTLPEGYEVDHLCRNRLCCNPKHLEAVTHSENMKRVWDRGARTGALCGAGNAGAKLTREEVDAIAKDQRSTYALASVYGVSRTTISRARRGITYKTDAPLTVEHASRAPLGREA